ncbi:MAG: primosomal protein N' [Clostridiales bacterium]|nr:primosomal protein N' [Clostridiales bacterium]
MAKQYASIIVNRKLTAVDKVFDYLIPPELARQVEVGSIVRIPFGSQRLEGVVVALPKEAPLATKSLEAVLSSRPLFDRHLLDLSRWLADHYLCPWVTALQAMLPAGLSLGGRILAPLLLKRYYPVKEALAASRLSKKQKAVLVYLEEKPGAEAKDLLAQDISKDTLNRLVKRGLVECREVEIAPAPADPWNLMENVELSFEQEAVFKRLCREETAKKPALLFGVTGSGKTEIYIRLIEYTLRRGKQALLLLPEIALTPQTVDFLRRRLTTEVAVLHSSLTDKERRLSWQGIAEGRLPLVVGARSAVFAPLKNLGLIVIDEEHESSYKQDNQPRFHAREVARERCRLSGAQLLLGSATPSLESWQRALTGEYSLLKLERRFHQPRLPQVRVVDMREELRRGNRRIFSRLLEDELASRLAAGEQSLLFLNRRGYYTFFSCRNCGQVIHCPHCALALTYHAAENRLKCHCCGRNQAPPKFCPVCGSSSIRYFGIGTQRVADEAAQLFPKARIARLDRDTSQKKGSYEQIYRQMLAGEIDILVGTQMIAKGLDFPQVTLAGAIAADTSLNLPDWRAGERTFQLLTQVAGRVGRRQKPGLAIIQTYYPASPVIQSAAAQDYPLFAGAELENRRNYNYPPFITVLRLLLSALDQEQLIRTAEAVAGYLKLDLPEGAELCGPAFAPWEKVKNRWRQQIILKGKNGAALGQAAVKTWQKVQSERLAEGVNLQLDMEPLNLM